MTDVTLRQATPDDWPQVRDELQRAELPVDDLAVGAMSSFIVAEDEGGVFLGAVAVERLGGFGLLRSLVVAPPARGRGVGQQLVTRVTTSASTSGVRELWLLTIDADGFFERLGYERVAREAAPNAVASTKEFTDLCPASAVLMRKTL